MQIKISDQEIAGFDRGSADVAVLILNQSISEISGSYNRLSR
jgi:hypothetical protein